MIDETTVIPVEDADDPQFALSSLPPRRGGDPRADAMDLAERNLPDVINHLVQIATIEKVRGRQITAKLAAIKLMLDFCEKNRPPEDSTAAQRREEHKRAILDLVRNHPKGQQILSKLKELGGPADKPEAEAQAS